MPLRVPDKRVWNFWLTQDGPDYHIFYLQAPWEAAGRETRHWYVSIGHAVSQDLINWELLPDILRPSVSEAWDDCATWTGSIVAHAGLWYFLYTGTKHSEEGLIQRIGLATSPDLLYWTKYPDNPVLEADARWYEQLNPELWHDQAWRDPWVFQHPDSSLFHALITARCNEGPADERGVIGQAQSSDLLHWDVLPPLTLPGEFGYLETPQLVEIQNRYYLLFSAPARFHSARRYQRTRQRPVTGTHYLIADQPLGPFRSCTDTFLVGEPTGLFYSGKLIQGPTGDWQFMTCYQFAPDGTFIGVISDPISVQIDEAGHLAVPWEAHRLTMAELLADLDIRGNLA